MSRLSEQKVASSNTVALESHALGTLQYIRASIDAASLLAVPGTAGIAMGSVGVLAAVLCSLPAFASQWLSIWLAAAAMAFLCGSALIAHQSLRRGEALFRGPVRKFLLCLCPALGVGVVLTGHLWLEGLPQTIPAVWLLMYGCGVLAASTMTVRPVALMGALFLVLGLAALRVPAAWLNPLLGLGFGGLHIAFGMLIGGRIHVR
jgi:hypothetical protein